MGSITNKPQPKTESDPILAYTMVKELLPQYLKSPSTAEFPSMWDYKDHVTDLGEHRYKVVSYVDSQNGFGAMIRTYFSCIIVFEGESARIEDLAFD